MNAQAGQRKWRAKGAKMRFSLTIFETSITRRALRQAIEKGDLTSRGAEAAQRALAKMDAAMGHVPDVDAMREGTGTGGEEDLDHDEE